MSEDFTTKSSFCVAPWIHYHRSPIGEHRLCCISEALPSDISDLPYEEIKNSEVMKNVRKQMMSGELPEQCKLCKHSNSHEVYKDILNGEFSHTFDSIVEKTDVDGTTTVEPLFLDYRFLACGLTCLTCNPFFSSKWVGLAKQSGLHHVEKNDSIDFLNAEFKRVLNKYKWERVSFAGGEPLMQKDHLADLKILQKQDRSIKYGIALSYNTNLMKDKEFVFEWVTLLNQFKNPGIMISVDSVGRINDLIRMGSSFKTIQENLNIINENRKPHLRMHIDLTMTSLFFFNLIEYSQWIVDNKYNLNARVVINQFSGNFLYFEILPLEFREEKMREWRLWFERLPKEDQDRLGNLRNVLESHFYVPTFPDEVRMHTEEEIRKVCAKQHADEIMALLGPHLPIKI